MHLRRSASGGDGEKEGSFPDQYLSGQVKKGLREALDKVARTRLQTPHGCNRAGNALGVFKTSNPSLKCRVQLGPMHAYAR